MLIPLDEIVRSVTTENPWWSTRNIPKRFADMARRAYFKPFHQLVSTKEINRAVILLGPRRVGKTVMTQHLIQQLIRDGTNPKRILYVSIDTPTYTGQSLQ
ncbi:AAA family ATPase, partial [Caulobacter sp. S45]|uniref:AAA family ATPase n=1 Tax=Caulobacter sp. S45 TaxID=1641861 RepID=UPI0015770711